MKKLALDLESLSVQSFATTPARRGARGTVNGHMMNTDNCRITQDAACGPWTTGPGPEPSAGGTCVLSACVPLTEPNDY
jgi:hypothetical protein